jgi:hypothetical protein
MKLRESTAALPEEQRKFLRDKQIEANWWPAQWMGFLTSLADHDARADAVRKRTGWWLTWAVLIGIAGAVGLVFVAPAAGIAFGVLALVAVIVLARAWSSMRRTDLPGDNMRFAATMVNVLQEDIAPQAGLWLRIDVRGPTDDAKKSHVSPQYKRGVYHKVVDTFYDDPWFGGGADLADDARLTWTIHDRTRSSKRTKRNPRGKIKTKTKLKKTTYFQVALALPAKNYAVAGVGEARGGDTKVKVKPAESRTNVRVTSVAKTTDVKAAPDPQQLIALIAEAYRRAQPSRRKKLS